MLNEFSNDHAGTQGSDKWNGWRETLLMLFLGELLSHGLLDNRTDLMPDSRAQPSLFLRGSLNDINFRHCRCFLQCAIRVESCQPASHAFRWFTSWVPKEAHQAGNIFAPRVSADLTTKISNGADDDHAGPDPRQAVPRIDVVNPPAKHR